AATPPAASALARMAAMTSLGSGAGGVSVAASARRPSRSRPISRAEALTAMPAAPPAVPLTSPRGAPGHAHGLRISLTRPHLGRSGGVGDPVDPGRGGVPRLPLRD